MCGLAVGITQGLGRHILEELRTSQDTCMLRGDAECEIRVQVVRSERG